LIPIVDITNLSIVIAGLAPAIHLLELTHFWTDARVKRAHDE